VTVVSWISDCIAVGTFVRELNNALCVLSWFLLIAYYAALLLTALLKEAFLTGRRLEAVLANVVAGVLVQLALPCYISSACIILNFGDHRCKHYFCSCSLEVSQLFT
jgi:hypothetical protein